MKIFVNHLGFKPGGIMNKYGFNFIRVASDYRFWTRNFDYQNPDTNVLNYFDEYLKACRERGLHLCINFHRAPGYCINMYRQ
jgi:endoglucanase